jgi:hypothetical protein
MANSVTCNKFDVLLDTSKLYEHEIAFTCHTDLPLGAVVILSCQRTYIDSLGKTALWIGHSDRLTVLYNSEIKSNCITGTINIDESDKQARSLYNQIHASDSAFVLSPVSSEFTMVFTVGARQRLREFGNLNINMSGTMVTKSGGINVVIVRQSIDVAMCGDYQPTLNKSV